MYPLTEEEAKEMHAPTPERYAELQKERRSNAIEALTWFDKEEMQEIVKVALEVVEDGRRQIAYLNERDELDEMQRQREWRRRYNAAMGKEPEPIDDEIPW
jgi:hypothetical protein